MKSGRLFEMLYLLLQRERISAKEFSERLGVSTRTVFRDVEALSMAGVPIYTCSGKGGGISLLPDFLLDRTLLTEGEKQEVLSSIAALRQIAPFDGSEALDKLSAVFGKTGVDWIEADFSEWSARSGEVDSFSVLKQAVLEKRVVAFNYSSLKGETAGREVCPLKLCFKDQAWYLYGFCRRREENRFFKISRMKNLRLTGEHHSLTMRGRVLDRVKNTEQSSIAAELLISPQMAFRVLDEIPDYCENADGSFTCRAEFSDIGWLISYVLSYGCAVKVLSPDWLREKIKAELLKTLENYS